MSEPHQRVQSGKLRRPSRQNRTESSNDRVYQQQDIATGIENATYLESNEWDDDILVYYQTPTSLTDLHISILSKIALGCGIKDTSNIDRDWRRTWNIGSWNVGNKVSISINLMQPNIANCWAVVSGVSKERIQDIASEYTNTNLPNSTCKISGINSISIQGRWTLSLLDRLLKESLITENQYTITGINITQCKLFCWVVLNTGSEYLCTLTEDSVQILTRYLPDWCSDICEPNAANNVTLRIRSPTNPNDASQLAITVLGNLQYTGKLDNIDKLYKALSIAIDNTINSKHIKLFLESLHYKKANN